ncbi:MAG: hypothetical protein K6E50_12150 [Lachnospiraceae bacterium]|nr:hypothetical protein [Lachnospiraceae bacterium]
MNGERGFRGITPSFLLDFAKSEKWLLLKLGMLSLAFVHEMKKLKKKAARASGKARKK